MSESLYHYRECNFRAVPIQSILKGFKTTLNRPSKRLGPSGPI